MSKMKKTLALILALMMLVTVLAGCNNEENPNPDPDPNPNPDPNPDPEPTPDTWDGAYIDAEDFKAYVANDLEQMASDMNIANGMTAEQVSAVDAAVAAGKEAINAAGTVADVMAAYDAAVDSVANCVPLASGMLSYADRDDNARLDMLAALEAFGYRTGIVGIPLFENGSTNLYSERLVLGTEKYIPGYGFGTLSEGSITADLEYESNPAWKRYYHTINPQDPGTLNALDDNGSESDDFYSQMAASYFTTFMNETKDGYDWVPLLAKTMPEAMNDDDGNGSATKWRFEVRTGETDGLKYTTGSQIESRQAFNNRPVELEDYLTPFKLLLTKSNDYYRGSDMADNTTGAIVGLKAFYDGTAGGFNQNLWDQVGIKVYQEDGKNYLEYEFTQEFNQFYAMYYFNETNYMPIPQEFLDLVTPQFYLGYNTDGTETPMDNGLALGPYYVESYVQDQEIVYKKNPNYVYADTKYAIEGIHYRILPAAKEDPEAAFNEFLAGHIDVASIPQTRLNEYRNDPRARTTTGEAVFKLNINALDQDTWVKLNGVNGTSYQNEEADYWECEPALSNAHFRQGILLSIDRQTYATNRGSIASVDYLASNYMYDPVNGRSYSGTEQHAKVIAPLVESTDGYGYSLELARDYFRAAMTELEAEGAYTPGTAENPTVITIEIAWMYPQHEETYHNEIKSFLETAFNDPSVTDGKYKLEITFWVGNTYEEMYDRLQYCKFDIGFGSISGNPFNPLDFMSVLSVDPDLSSGFTLSWAADTNDPSSYPIVYDGQRFSYDAFWLAANSQALVADGVSKDSVTWEYTAMTKNDDGSYTGSMVATLALPDQMSLTVTDVVCCNYERYYNGDGTYDEQSVEFTTEDLGNGSVKITFTVPANLAADYATGSGTSAEPAGQTGFDFYFDLTANGSTSSSYYSAYDNFVVE